MWRDTKILYDIRVRILRTIERQSKIEIKLARIPERAQKGRIIQNCYQNESSQAEVIIDYM